MFIKEYYPLDYLKLKKYISEGRWNIAGSSLDAGDVNIPYQSDNRSILYGQSFYQKNLVKRAGIFFCLIVLVLATHYQQLLQVAV